MMRMIKQASQCTNVSRREDMFTNNQNKNLKYLVKYHSPDASGFYSRISSKTHTTFVYKDIESARLSAILQQVKANAKG